MTNRKIPRAGFTLIEVLIAIVILAIGVLALQAMAIAAARATTLAEKQSDYAVTASASMERLRYRVNARVITTFPNGSSYDVPMGGRDSATVTDSVTKVSTGRYQLTVKVAPKGTKTIARPQTMRVTAYIYNPSLP